MLSVLRLALIPAFIYLFVTYDDKRWYAFAVFAFASATDILDGYIARKHNWVTPAGKILDPLADKLMQAAVICCITFDKRENPFFILLAALFLFKETAMGVGSLIIIRRKHKIAASNWFGKAATVAFFIITSIYMFYNESEVLNFILGILLVLVLIGALLLYYFKVFRGLYGLKIRKKE